MAQKLMGKKVGMTQRFDAEGNVIVCTIIEAEPNVITQIKTIESDGYNAVQLGFDELKATDPRTVERRVGKPLAGHFKRAGVAPRRFLMESWIDNPEDYKVGDEVTVGVFKDGDFIDVTGVTKGRGYQGVIRLHGFAGGPGAHGSGFHRHMGSTGMRSTPGRCLPGGKRASQMGNRRRTVQSLKIVAVDAQKNVIVVKGAIPGYNGALVALAPSVKKGSGRRKPVQNRAR